MTQIFRKRGIQLLAVVAFSLSSLLQVSQAMELPAGYPSVEAAKQVQLPAKYPIQKIDLGNVTVWAVVDSPITFNASTFGFGVEFDPVKQKESGFVDGKQLAITQVHLVKLPGGRLVLCDAGWGKEQYATSGYDPGYAYERLIQAGVNPNDITDVILTHMDIDHAPGIVDKGARLYPNATVHVAREEFEGVVINGYGRPPDAVQWARNTARVYRDRMNMFEYNQDIIPGIKPIATKGHSPGHTAYIVSSDSRGIALSGDLLHSYPLQFRWPLTSYSYDADHHMVVESRIAFLETLVDKDTLFVGCHYPDIGTVRRNPEGGYKIIPQPTLVTIVDGIDYK